MSNQMDLNVSYKPSNILKGQKNNRNTNKSGIYWNLHLLKGLSYKSLSKKNFVFVYTTDARDDLPVLGDPLCD